MSPHVNDRAVRTACADLLGLDRGDVRCDTAGRPRLDHAEHGQLHFQALLAAAVMHSTRDDLSLQVVRNAVTLRSVSRYLTSIVDCGDRLVMRTRSPGRVAARLLPSLYPGDVVAGVPGLRVHEVTPRILQLAHLPTGGRLDLVGSYAHSATAAGQREHLADELELAAHEDDVSLHSLEHVHPGEANHLHFAPAPTCVRLLSAVLARAIALWWHYGIEPAWSPPSTLAWRLAPGPRRSRKRRRSRRAAHQHSPRRPQHRLHQDRHRPWRPGLWGRVHGPADGRRLRVAPAGESVVRRERTGGAMEAASIAAAARACVK